MAMHAKYKVVMLGGVSAYLAQIEGHEEKDVKLA
jgi:hypothetical protein